MTSLQKSPFRVSELHYFPQIFSMWIMTVQHERWRDISIPIVQIACIVSLFLTQHEMNCCQQPHPLPSLDISSAVSCLIDNLGCSVLVHFAGSAGLLFSSRATQGRLALAHCLLWFYSPEQQCHLENKVNPNRYRWGLVSGAWWLQDARF